MKGLVYLENRGKVAMEELAGIMAMPASQQRFLWYTRKVNNEFSVTQTWVSDDDQFLYVKRTQVNVRFNKKLYCKYTPLEGYAFNTVTKDIKPWFGKPIKSLNEEMLAPLLFVTSLDWLSDAITDNTSYKKMLDLSILKRVLKGKITNRLDLVKAYVKSSPSFQDARVMPCSRIVKYLNEKRYHSLDEVLPFIKVSVNPEATANRYLDLCQQNVSFLRHWADPNQSWINFGDDLMYQARVLGKKIDFTWSYKRMCQVHDEWTNDIMGLELDMVPDTNFNYKGEVFLPEGVKLIDNSKDLFKEGTEMRHCVYTNHRYEVMDKKEFIFCGKFNNDRFTVSVVQEYRHGDMKKVFGISQMYGKHNSRVDAHDREIMEQWIKLTAVQEWLHANYNTGDGRSYELDALPELPF